MITWLWVSPSQQGAEVWPWKVMELLSKNASSFRDLSLELLLEQLEEAKEDLKSEDLQRNLPDSDFSTALIPTEHWGGYWKTHRYLES